jgi:hypothetical protein
MGNLTWKNAVCDNPLHSVFSLLPAFDAAVVRLPHGSHERNARMGVTARVRGASVSELPLPFNGIRCAHPLTRHFSPPSPSGRGNMAVTFVRGLIYLTLETRTRQIHPKGRLNNR